MPGRWEKLAASEPYFTVLGDDRFLLKNLDGLAESEFFATGDAQVAELYSTIRQRITPLLAPRDVLEVGCGVGRLAIPFAARADLVTAIDVAPTMLRIAQARAARAELTLELMTPDELWRTDRLFDLVSCHLIFHRLPAHEGLELLKQAADRVRPGGAGVFQFAIRSHASRAVEWSRRMRVAMPPVNAIANIVRGKSFTVPFLQNTIHDLSTVMGILHNLGFQDPYVTVKREGDIDTATLYALRPGSRGQDTRADEAPPHRKRDSMFIDVRDLIARASIEEHSQQAERYFTALTDPNDHLAKPFAQIQDAPQILINQAVILQGLSLASGMTVLEFGAGTGWLSHGVTQLGCSAILLDVSPTALDIARQLYLKHPTFGDKPAPHFLVFDGRRIDLPDASVDRIICFDAFHHTPNPDDVIREFARVLRPGGIAGFAEPGPNHSITPHSQYEMRTHGVIENDIDLHAITVTAKRAGFVDVRVAILNVHPFHVSLSEHDDLMAGGDTLTRWGDATRNHLRETRLFFLKKEGTEIADSRRADGLHATLTVSVATPVRAGEPVRIHGSVLNSGRAVWLPSGQSPGGVCFGCHLHDQGGRLLKLDYAWHPLPQSLAPGEEIELDAELAPLEQGRYILEFDCVADRVTWFAQVGSMPVRVEVNVE